MTILQPGAKQVEQPRSDPSTSPNQNLPTVDRTIPIAVKWNIPSWMLRAPVEPHMQEAPEELDIGKDYRYGSY